MSLSRIWTVSSPFTTMVSFNHSRNRVHKAAWKQHYTVDVLILMTGKYGC